MPVHGDNLRQKETGDRKYADDDSKELLEEIRAKYDVWRAYNEGLMGPSRLKCKEDSATISQRTEAFADYKEFIDQQVYAEHFDSRSNLHSSVIEEFIFYLFRDLVASFSGNALIGKGSTFKDIFFLPPNYEAMLTRPYARVEKKDHDFVIGVEVAAQFKARGQIREEVHSFEIPAVAIECKTYLDKTMLEGSSTSGEQLKIRNPNAIYLVVAEWLKLTQNVNLKKYKVDQIYVLRKQKNTDREFRFAPDYDKNPIYIDVVEHLYETVRNHLCSDWEGGVVDGLERGWLL